MSDDFGEIRPKTVPLTHSASARPHSAALSHAKNAARRLGLMAFVAIAVIGLGVVFFVVPDFVTPPETELAPAPNPQDPARGRPREDADLPPYQTLLRQQAREKAQDELARFVELQLQLEQQMQVGEWGLAAYDNAKILATAGDEQFLAEDFDASIASYQAASEALAQLIATGEKLFGTAMAAGLQALDERDEQRSLTEFSKALTIDPNDPDAQLGKQRAERLPQVNQLMRRAKNHELSGEFDAALAVYEQVRSLDAQTFGLAEAISETREGYLGEQVKAQLSAGFSALDQGKLQTARSAFNQALKLDPGNPVALGGLEQVVDKSTNTRIDDLRRLALSAEQAEDWQTAANHYAAVLKVDGNIQFARDGRARVAAQQKVLAGLGNIASTPENLSSSELFHQAEALLAQAQRLEPRGPRLAKLLEQVAALIEAYRYPIAVTILSDNLTQVTLSTVGRLGSFERKEVSLRPGAYTLIGSRDGCRDVRQNIIVRPNMRPIDVRCVERL